MTKYVLPIMEITKFNNENIITVSSIQPSDVSAEYTPTVDSDQFKNTAFVVHW